MKNKNLYKILCATLLVSPIISSCKPADVSSSSSTSGADENVSLRTVNFDITLDKHLDNRYTLGVLSEHTDYNQKNIVKLESKDNRGHFVGSLKDDSFIDFTKNDKNKYEYKLVVLDSLDFSVISNEYISSVISINCASTDSAISSIIRGYEMNLPSKDDSFFITSIYDSDNNDEDITLTSLKYLTYTDKDGNEKQPDDFAIGDTVYVNYSSPTLMDGRTIITKATLGVNVESEQELKFEETGSAKSPVYRANFIKMNKDERIKIYIGYEFLLGIDSESSNYIESVNIVDSEGNETPLDIASLVNEPVYLRRHTQFKVTINSSLPGDSFTKVVGVKLNSPDSYAYESNNLISGESFTTSLTANDQLIRLITAVGAVNINTRLKDTIETTDNT